MRQARRGEAYLGIAKAGADAPEHGTLGDPQPVEPDDRAAAGHEPVQSVEHPFDTDPRRVHRRQEHRGAGRSQCITVVLRHDDRERGADGVGWL
jgi:hypothetical protein